MPDFLRREIILFIIYFSVLFYRIVLYWAFGMLLGSLISVFGKNKLHSRFAAMQDKDMGLIGIIPASLIGIVSPLCMFGTIPISASFAKAGMREDWLVAFMMSSILLNPQLLFFTAALGPFLLIVRFISGFLCGITAGLLVYFFFESRSRKFLKLTGFGQAGNRDTDPNIFLRFLKNLGRNVKATGPAFLIGITLATLFQRYVPAEAMTRLFGHPGFGYLMAATLGVPLHICGGATIPMLLLWLHRGMSLGAGVIFMIIGPAMKMTNLGAVKTILGVKHFLFYLLFSVVFGLLCGLLIDFFVVPIIYFIYPLIN